MRKLYLAAASLFIGTMAMAQHQTLVSHFQPALTNQAGPQIAILSWSEGAGYISGTNNYGEQAIVQRFDSNFGVTTGGTIDSIYAFIPYKTQSATPGSYGIGIWEDNGGTLGNLITSVNLSINDIDTSAAATKIIVDGNGVPGGLYNVAVAIDEAIPANQAFFAGVILPTSAANGDTIVVLTTADGEFTTPDYAGSINANGDFDAWSNYGIGISNAIFPVVTLGEVSIAEELKANTRLYPNPVTDVLNIEFGNNTVKQVNILSINGQVVATSSVINGKTTMNVNSLERGLYLYQAMDEQGNVLLTNKFVKQ